ncbi:sensor histidine kinase [Tissierella sp. MB52-C2]|uniref:sensor histidine kinase n=1 Tax=Tissierella sp. MB52-C2 TaxID=3070999 RepID=UPI00280C3827|nr:sensor histidine kinase [Tissierella sp. MB52-C2]WMM25733.1 sensor histidine kinase [Tissierella sp. MB52-C2]
MNKTYKYNRYLYKAVLILIGMDVIYRCRDNNIKALICFVLFLVIVINDYLRQKYFYKTVKEYYSSIALGMIINLILSLHIEGYIDIYFYLILYELILYGEGKISRLFISLEVISLLALISFRMISGYDNIGYYDILGIIMVSTGICFYLVSLFGYKALRKEKREVERLNKELELSYEKLKEQSKKIEELTISKERNRVAEEIHDNLGHNLIALNMNLDVAEKIIDRDMDKAKELINKSYILAKRSMEDLRKAVYALKEKVTKTFIDSLKEIVANIEYTGKVKIILDVEESIEEILPEYKDIIYTSIKEIITNSVKHGKCDEINISIKLSIEEINIIVADNGVGCDEFVKGNGLLGIEKRIMDYKGKINYDNSISKGFKIELVLPNL